MRRLACCLLSSMIVHAGAWMWVGARFSVWKEALAAAAAPASPEVIEVEAVAALPAAPPGESGGGGGARTPALARPLRHRASAPAPSSARAPDGPTAAPTTANTSLAASGASATGSGQEGPEGIGLGSGIAPTGSGPGSGVGPSGAGLADIIAARIGAHRRYPLLARRQGLEGTVEVVFRVDAAGRAVDLRIDKSAGALFDDAALDAVRAAAPLPACAQPIRVPIRFRLVEERAIR